MRSRLCRIRSKTITPGAAGVLLGCALVVLSSCQMTPVRVSACPLTFDQQSAEIVGIAPLGTPRDAAVELLADAGIRGNFAHMSNSIYYCDLWERPDGERWHTQVALLFDDEGLLYATRPADAAVSAGQAQTAAAAGDSDRAINFEKPEDRNDVGGGAAARRPAETSPRADARGGTAPGVRTGVRTPVGAL